MIPASVWEADDEAEAFQRGAVRERAGAVHGVADADQGADGGARDLGLPACACAAGTGGLGGEREEGVPALPGRRAVDAGQEAPAAQGGAGATDDAEGRGT